MQRDQRLGDVGVICHRRDHGLHRPRPERPPFLTANDRPRGILLNPSHQRLGMCRRPPQPAVECFIVGQRGLRYRPAPEIPPHLHIERYRPRHAPLPARTRSCPERSPTTKSPQVVNNGVHLAQARS